MDFGLAFFRAISAPQTAMLAAVACWLPAEVAASGAYSASCYDSVKDIWILSIVESKSKLIGVQWQIFCGHFVVAPHDATSEQRPERFDALSVRATPDIFVIGVVHHFVFVAELVQRPVMARFIGRNQRYVTRENLFHKLLVCIRLVAVDNLADDIAFTGDGSDHFRLPRSALTMCAMLAEMLVLLFAADKNLIDLDLAHQLHKFIVLHRCSDARAHIPSRLVRASSDHAMNLMRAHSLFGMQHHENDAEPFTQRIVRSLENRPTDDAESIAVLLVANGYQSGFGIDALFAALAQIVKRAGFQRVRLGAAARAFHLASGPAFLCEKGFTGIVIREAVKQFSQRHLTNGRSIHVKKDSAFLGRCQMPDNPQNKPTSGPPLISKFYKTKPNRSGKCGSF